MKGRRYDLSLLLLSLLLMLPGASVFAWTGEEHELLASLARWDTVVVDRAEFADELGVSESELDKAVEALAKKQGRQPDDRKSKRLRAKWTAPPFSLIEALAAGLSHDYSHRGPQAFEAAVKWGKQRAWREAHVNLAHAFHYMQDRADVSSLIDTAPGRHGRRSAVRDLAQVILTNLSDGHHDQDWLKKGDPQLDQERRDFIREVARYGVEFASLTEPRDFLKRLDKIRDAYKDPIRAHFPMPADRKQRMALRREIRQLLAAIIACENRLIELFNQETEVKTSVVFVLDASGSMDETEPGATQTRFAKAKRDLLNALTNQSAQTETALIVFHGCGSVHVSHKFTRDAKLIRQALAGVAPAGGTPLAEATDAGYTYMHEHALSSGARHTLVLSDGGESCGGDPVASAGRFPANVAPLPGAAGVVP